MSNSTVSRITKRRQYAFDTSNVFCGVTPYRIGQMDAEAGYPFCPEEYYVRRADMLAYTDGFESVRGKTAITRSFRVGNGLVTDAMIDEWQEQAELDELAAEYEDWQEDIEWMRRGC